jgi:hypothetical protein
MTKYILLSIVFSAFGLLSCNKGCDFPADENKGKIVEGAIVFGFNSGGVAHVIHDGNYIYQPTVSFDNGFTYVAVNWGKYSVINFPITAGCNTHYIREVTANGATAKYKIIVESCPDCENEYITDNWVLVEKAGLPPNFAVTYEKKVN